MGAQQVRDDLAAPESLLVSFAGVVRDRAPGENSDRHRPEQPPGSLPPASSDQFVNLGARGELTPLLTGQIRLGLSHRQEALGQTGNLLGTEAQLAYACTPKTSLTCDLSSDFGNAATGESTRRQTVSLGAAARISEALSVNCRAGYTSTGYPTRRDEFLVGSAGVSYVFSRQLSTHAALICQNNRSAASGVGFSQRVLSLGADWRY